MSNVVKCQHHVSKSYLREWSTRDRLFCLQDGRIRLANIKDVAVERHFNQLHALEPDDISYLQKMWIDPFPHSRQVNNNYMMMFTLSANLRRELTAEFEAKHPEFVKELDQQIINTEEEYHSRLETDFSPLIESARQGKIDFYEDADRCIPFLLSLCVQYFRTNGMKRKMIDLHKATLGIDLSRVWNVLSHILATNVAYSLFRDRKRMPLALLENNTELPFITSDQPVINLLGTGSDTQAPTHLALYYPIHQTERCLSMIPKNHVTLERFKYLSMTSRG
ncbi:MAG TPA: DUF4238 domain-containing protein [Rhizomicrobium sp.]|jgi:hypothetical protein|nr:DUF4238 domain-containing protein [Rhizomicrobium sp.]